MITKPVLIFIFAFSFCSCMSQQQRDAEIYGRGLQTAITSYRSGYYDNRTYEKREQRRRETEKKKVCKNVLLKTGGKNGRTPTYDVTGQVGFTSFLLSNNSSHSLPIFHSSSL